MASPSIAGGLELAPEREMPLGDRPRAWVVGCGSKSGAAGVGCVFERLRRAFELGVGLGARPRAVPPGCGAAASGCVFLCVRGVCRWGVARLHLGACQAYVWVRVRRTSGCVFEQLFSVTASRSWRAARWRQTGVGLARPAAPQNMEGALVGNRTRG